MNVVDIEKKAKGLFPSVYSHLSLISLAIFWTFSASKSLTFSAKPMTWAFQVSLTVGTTRFWMYAVDSSRSSLGFSRIDAVGCDVRT